MRMQQTARGHLHPRKFTVMLRIVMSLQDAGRKTQDAGRAFAPDWMGRHKKPDAVANNVTSSHFTPELRTSLQVAP
jgi:hypothetical protein